jgi:hypothetical protein
MARRNREGNETEPTFTPGPKGQERNNLFPASEADNGAVTDNFYIRTTVPATAEALDRLLPYQKAETPTLYAGELTSLHGVTTGPLLRRNDD